MRLTLVGSDEDLLHGCIFIHSFLYLFIFSRPAARLFWEFHFALSFAKPQWVNTPCCWRAPAVVLRPRRQTRVPSVEWRSWGSCPSRTRTTSLHSGLRWAFTPVERLSGLQLPSISGRQAVIQNFVFFNPKVYLTLPCKTVTLYQKQSIKVKWNWKGFFRFFFSLFFMDCVQTPDN